jgi:hypothetical protein
MAKGTKTGGRKAGTPNKITAALKEAILLAADNAGGEGGMVGYLTRQASENPPAFLSLLGKVLPMTVQGDASSPLHQIVTGVPRANRDD